MSESARDRYGKTPLSARIILDAVLLVFSFASAFLLNLDPSADRRFILELLEAVPGLVMLTAAAGTASFMAVSGCVADGAAAVILGSFIPLVFGGRPAGTLITVGTAVLVAAVFRFSSASKNTERFFRLGFVSVITAAAIAGWTAYAVISRYGSVVKFVTVAADGISWVVNETVAMMNSMYSLDLGAVDPRAYSYSVITEIPAFMTGAAVMCAWVSELIIRLLYRWVFRERDIFPRSRFTSIPASFAAVYLGTMAVNMIMTMIAPDGMNPVYIIVGCLFAATVLPCALTGLRKLIQLAKHKRIFPIIALGVSLMIFGFSIAASLAAVVGAAVAIKQRIGENKARNDG